MISQAVLPPALSRATMWDVKACTCLPYSPPCRRTQTLIVEPCHAAGELQLLRYIIAMCLLALGVSGIVEIGFDTCSFRSICVTLLNIVLGR